MSRACRALCLWLLTGCETRVDLLGDGAAAVNDVSVVSDVRVDARGEVASLLPNGGACSGDLQCASAFCRDAVCCDLACTGPCSRCDAPGARGRCSFVFEGQLPPSGKLCAASPKEQCQLDGTCDGQGSCRRWPAGTICRPAQCETIAQPTRLKLAWTCDGEGACAAFAPAELDCAPYGCDGTQQGCFVGCSAAEPLSCKKGVSCDGGRCGGSLLPLGVPCGKAGECDSGRCVEGVCCAGDCNGSCETCAFAGAVGRCVPVPSATLPPTGKTCAGDPLNPCAGDGMCDGKKACRMRPASTPCGAPSCTNATLTLYVCTGDPLGPACVKKQISCGAYLCQADGLSCFGSCATGAQCESGHLCSKGQCVQCVTADDCRPGQVCLNTQCI
jgi:hypothetical protein